jgi:NDP-sugar pyrophosphorylase family protein/aminoglycoside/choline kinase family phosphotransferase
MAELRGLVLAAGLGTRLRPLADYVPKPLLPVAGVTLLDRAIAALDLAGVGRIAVNAHHRADRIAAHLAARVDRARFQLSVEPRILGTGGALDGVRAFLAEAPRFVVHNGDVLSDLEVATLVAAHAADAAPAADKGALATLVVVDWPAVNSVTVGADGCVRDLARRLPIAPSPGDRALTFTGIACYERAFLDLIPAGASSLVDALVQLLRERPGAVRALVHAGQWEDLGTLDRYLDAHRRLLGPHFVSRGHGAVIPPDVELDECVVLDGAVVPAGVHLRRAVCGRGWAVSERVAATPALDLARRAGLDPDRGCTLHWIEGHGSDRRFVRLAQGERRAVLMSGDPEPERTLAINAFLYDGGLGAPAVLAHDPRSGSILLEDLGEDTLEALVARQPARAADLYDRVLDRLADLQTFGAERRTHCPRAWDRRFDREHLRWETDYFRARFLVGHAGLVAADLTGLATEFAALADACLHHPCTLVHRDFQAQNILFKDGMVRLVDVQGMRWGPVAYDAVSLLYDPYVALPWPLREELLATFPARLAARGGAAPDRAEWRAMTLACGLQRLMQALGAFAYLGHERNRPAFLAHIPAGLGHLRRLLALAPTLPPSPLGPPPLPHLAAVLAGLTSTEAGS